MDAAPEIVAVSAAREVTDRARAMEALSDKPSDRSRLVFGLFIFVAMFGGSFIVNHIDAASDWKPYLAGGIVLLFMTPVVLYFEIRQLKRRVKALTYLLLQQER